MNLKKLCRFKISIFSAVFLVVFLILSPNSVWAISSVKDTLETSRASFYTALEGNHSSGTTLITIDTTNYASNSTANLFPGDSVTIDDGSYTVDNIVNSSQFTITTPLDASDADDNDIIYVNRTSQHVVSLTTGAAIPNGAFRIKIKAATSNFNDSKPDQTGFDFHSMVNGDVTCPGDTTGYDFVSGTATVSGSGGCPSGYHCFECRYSGVGNTATSLSFTIGGTNELINPSLGIGHTAGSADTYTVAVDNLDSSYSTVTGESSSLKVAVIESVRVTATVEPTITFTITGVGLGQSRCGTTTDAASTPTSVPFGSISLGAFNDAAQQLSCVTNALHGYAVTVIENDQLSINGEHSTELSDTDCDNGSCTHTTSDEWSSDTSDSGFGFSIQNIDADTVPFQYTTSDSPCTGTFCARQIPSTADSDSALTVMSNSSTPSSTEDIYMCYRLVASTSQPAVDYENALTYVATATF